MKPDAEADPVELVAVALAEELGKMLTQAPLEPATGRHLEALNELGYVARALGLGRLADALHEIARQAATALLERQRKDRRQRLRLLRGGK